MGGIMKRLYSLSALFLCLTANATVDLDRILEMEHIDRRDNSSLFTIREVRTQSSAHNNRIYPGNTVEASVRIENTSQHTIENKTAQLLVDTGDAAHVIRGEDRVEIALLKPGKELILNYGFEIEKSAVCGSEIHLKISIDGKMEPFTVTIGEIKRVGFGNDYPLVEGEVEFDMTANRIPGAEDERVNFRTHAHGVPHELTVIAPNGETKVESSSYSTDWGAYYTSMSFWVPQDQPEITGHWKVSVTQKNDWGLDGVTDVGVSYSAFIWVCDEGTH